jgi:hypothetical protein
MVLPPVTTILFYFILSHSTLTHLNGAYSMSEVKTCQGFYHRGMVYLRLQVREAKDCV